MQLLVLGMHRSGTSAVARLLNMMGAYFAPEEQAMPSTYANPKGYWERKDIAKLHDDMLSALGFSWHNLADFSVEQLQDEKLLNFTPRIAQILQNLDSHRPWMAKDPRFCLFLPIWQRFLEVPVYLYVYRHPLEIALSLQTREEKAAALPETALHPLHAANYPPEAVRFPLSLGVALWEKYTLHSIQDAAAEIPRIWISYHELMNQPVETVQTLFQTLQQHEVQGLRLPSNKEILAHLEKNLHRQKHEDAETQHYLNTQQQALIAAIAAKPANVAVMQGFTLSGTASDALQAHRDSLQIAIQQQTLYSRLAEEKEKERLSTELHQQSERAAQALNETIHNQETALAASRQQIQTLEGKVHQYKAYLSTALLNLADKEGEFVQVQARLTEQEQQVQALLQSLEATQQHKNQVLHYTNALEVDIESIFGSLTWRSGSLFTRLALMLMLRKPSATAQDHIREIRQQLAQLKTGSPAPLPPAVPAPGVRQMLSAPAHNPNDYAAWGRQFDSLSGAQRRSILHWLKQQSALPLFSIIMPVYNTPEKYLKAALESVLKQLYPNWELCIADDASTDARVKKLLVSYAQRDARIKVCYRLHNGHISAASNSALELAEGDWITFLDHDDELAETALFWVYKAILDAPDALLFYSDEDKITVNGERRAPHFKPAWNPDLFLSYNYLNHLSVYRAERVREAGGLREGFEGAQDYDLALRVSERLSPQHICHIPRILYHWRVTESSTAGQETQKPYALLAAQKAISEHLARCQIDARVSDAPELLGANRVTYALPDAPPLVSIIIPTYNGLALMQTCINSIRRKTTYPHYEILVVDNNSDDPAALLYFDELQEKGWARVIQYPQPFNFAAINNQAVDDANGEILCLLNNDIEVISPDWLSEMVGHALRPDIGAVGARLWYPNHSLQHGGVITGLGGVAGHSHKYLPKGDPGYMGRAVITQNFSAVTAACLVLRKAVYQQVDGMNTEHLKVAFNDVDFCLRIGELGLRQVWTPYAELYHHESISRGHENTLEKIRRFQGEMTYMKTRWRGALADDLAYSPNLTQDTENFAYAWPPRVTALNDALAGAVTVRHGAFSALPPPALRQAAPVAEDFVLPELTVTATEPAAAPAPAPAPVEAAMPAIEQQRQPAYCFLRGQGAQIRPFTLAARLPADCQVVYADLCSHMDTASIFREVPAECFVPIEHCCNLDSQDLPLRELDFIICHDELPRVANPIRVLQRLFAALRPGGHLVVSVPDKLSNFNRYRPLSAFAELQQRYTADLRDAPDADYVEFLRHVHPNVPTWEVQQAVAQSRRRREHIHVWDAKQFAAFMQTAVNWLAIPAAQVFASAEQGEVLQVWQKSPASAD